MPIEKHEIIVGNTLTPLSAALKQRDSSGALVAVNLTGLIVKFKMVDRLGTIIIAETPTGVTVTDAANGLVEYDFESGNSFPAGDYYAWFTVYSGFEFDTYPASGRGFLIRIRSAS